MNAPLLALLFFAGAGVYFGLKSEKTQNALDKSLFKKIFAPLKALENEYYSNSGIIIDAINEDSIGVNTMGKILYGIKLEGGGNTATYLDENIIKELYRNYKNTSGADFYYSILKSGFYHRQYIFSYNKNLLSSIATYFEIKFMSGQDIANAILDLFLQNSYAIENNDIKRNISLSFNSKLDSNYKIFKKLVRENIYQNLNQTDVYQAYKPIEGITKTKISDLLAMNFDGCITTYFDLSRKSVENAIDRLVATAKMNGNKTPFMELKQAYSEGNINLAVINSQAWFKKVDKSILGNFGTNLKMDFIKKDIFKSKSLQRTMFKFRDTEYDFLAPDSFVANMVCSVQKKKISNADFYGFDKNRGFINYSFESENFNPHTFIIATSGGGKSFALQKIVSTMINVNYETAEAQNLGKDRGVLVRYYDIGFSSDRFVNFLKSNPKNNIAHIKSEFSSFAYNLVNIDISNADTFRADLVFAGDLANLILASQEGSNLMTTNELATFISTLQQIYETKNFQKYRVREIKNTKLLDEIKALGYKDNDYLQDIKEDGYDFLKKPLLTDVIKVAKIQSENQQLTETSREEYQGLVKKLQTIDRLEIFSRFDNEDINADFLSMDLNNFKENSLFTPIFVSIFQKVYLKDRADDILRKNNNMVRSKKLYIIEESVNFFRVPYFSVLLDKLAQEARKYKVHLILVAQKLEHIPKSILTTINTRIFLSASSLKAEYINAIKTYFDPPKAVIEQLDLTNQYELCVWYSGGVFNLNFPFSDFEKQLFSTSSNDQLKKEIEK
ncbi:hypothetical protein A9K75_08520 [Campylobacter fetus subsp. testudinum]|uniref:ATP-binding protein n=1 Tax=Campylobacter fetus TaxID=196 RepID=UPI000818798C|nr:ATP-binding protein [Campylobacter fetus]OCR99079.1 hypothetical protein A9K75_08520 [Campylobacter fetus subsp. testudinum]